MVAEKTLWAIGLNELSVANLREYAKGDYTVKECSVEAFLALGVAEKGPVPAAFLSLEAWRAMQARDDSSHAAGLLSSILVTESPLSPAELENVTAQGVAAVLQLPLDPSRVHAVLLRVEENRRLCQDIIAMGKEIMLCREIVVQKEEHLQMLMRFLGDVSSASNPKILLQQAAKHLGSIMPVEGMSALVFHDDPEGKPLRTLFAPANPGSAAWKEWHGLLTGAETRLLNLPFLADAANHPANGNAEGMALSPEPGWGTVSLLSGESELAPCHDKRRLLLAPLHVADTVAGIVCVQFGRDYTAGRERLAVLNAALQHLAASLRVLLPSATIRPGTRPLAEPASPLPMRLKA